MEFLEVLTEGMERVLMVRGGGSEVITIFSWWIWNSTWRVARHPISLEVSVYGMIVFGRVRMARTAPIVATHCYVVVEHLYWLGWMTSGLKTRIKIVRSEWVVSAAGIQTHHNLWFSMFAWSRCRITHSAGCISVPEPLWGGATRPEKKL